MYSIKIKKKDKKTIFEENENYFINNQINMDIKKDFFVFNFIKNNTTKNYSQELISYKSLDNFETYLKNIKQFKSKKNENLNLINVYEYTSYIINDYTFEIYDNNKFICAINIAEDRFRNFNKKDYLLLEKKLNQKYYLEKTSKENISNTKTKLLNLINNNYAYENNNIFAYRLFQENSYSFDKIFANKELIKCRSILNFIENVFIQVKHRHIFYLLINTNKLNSITEKKLLSPPNLNQINRNIRR